MKDIPMKSNVTRKICIAFIDRLIRFPPDSVARYDIMKEIKKPFKQSWQYIELLCRAQTCIIKTGSYTLIPNLPKGKNCASLSVATKWIQPQIFKITQNILSAKLKLLLVPSTQEKFSWQNLHSPLKTYLPRCCYCTSV